MSVKVAPSILSADFLKISDEILSIKESGADLVHLDIMDGHFVPNITFGPFIIKQLRKLTDLPFDAHLMIDNPTVYLDSFKDAGCDMITVHVETEKHLHRTLQEIKSKGMKAGVSLNPHTPITFLRYVCDLVDLVLVMAVNPGFGGQSYIHSATRKINELKFLRKEMNASFEISVDGGVNDKTVKTVVEAGADILIMGSHFFGTDPSERSSLVNSVKSIG